MKNLFFISILLWTGLGIIFGYFQHAGGGEPSRSFADPDQPIDVGVNEEFTIALDANPTTGFLWRLSEPLDGSVLKFVRDEYKLAEAPGLTGGGGKHMWTFRTVDRGQAVISLTYSRPWEKGVAPLKKVTFTVNVR